MKMIFALLLIVLSLIGIADSGYITYDHYRGEIPVCGGGFDCGTVLQSDWATIGPIPISLLGLLFYFTMLLLGVLSYLEFDLSRQLKKLLSDKISKTHPLNFLQIQDLQLALATAGFLFSLYLIFIMAVVIQAWCLWCLVSATTSTLLFVFTALSLISLPRKVLITTHAVLNSTITAAYVFILKPFLFLLPPDRVHHLIKDLGVLLGKVQWLRLATEYKFGFRHPSLEQKLGPIPIHNPIGLSAGFDYDAELTQIMPAVGFGFMTVGTVTYDPYEGNMPPRLSRLPRSRSLIVNKGFKSQGARAITRRLESLHFEIPVGISIGSTNREFSGEAEQILDILKCFLLFEKSRVRHSFYELNISCPNTKGGQPFTTPDRLQHLLTALDGLQIRKPIFVKMPIDQPQQEIDQLLKIIVAHGLNGVIFGNLTKDHQNPAVSEKDRKIWASTPGNLSGKPTWDRSNALVKFAKQEYGNKLTIIGTGGIFSGEDAAHKLKIGADAVQLITGMIYQGPQSIGGMNNYLARTRLASHA